MPESAPKPPGFIHVDLDGLWTLAGVYGYDEGDGFERDPLFTIGLERLLDRLDARRLRATFFIVGRDLRLPAKRDAVARIAAAGHELANHSHNHRIDLERQPAEVIRGEIERTSDAIEALAGARPIGFRAPGYAAGPRTLAACSVAGMLYDGSCLPTRWSAQLRRMAGRLRRRVQADLGDRARPVPESDQYGGLPPAGANPLSPGWWTPPDGGRALYRIPLAVSPVLRLPLHASLGIMLGARRVRAGLRALAAAGRPVCYLLHAMDVVGPEELGDRLPGPLAAQRSIRLSVAAKLAFLDEILDELAAATRITPTGDWVRRQQAERPGDEPGGRCRVDGCDKKAKHGEKSPQNNPSE
jgi:peptidoglycan/xylan/chitin deacetylase (PgdA/CDA1 family)